MLAVFNRFRLYTVINSLRYAFIYFNIIYAYLSIHDCYIELLHDIVHSDSFDKSIAMLTKKDNKIRQFTAKSDSSDERNSGDIGEKLVPQFIDNVPDTRFMISAISQSQLNILISLFDNIIDQRFQKFEQRIERRLEILE